MTLALTILGVMVVAVVGFVLLTGETEQERAMREDLDKVDSGEHDGEKSYLV